MKNKILMASLLATCLAGGEVHAQVGFGGMFPGPGTVHSTGGGGYSGPGDITTYAMWWGTYAYSAATRGTKALRICNVADVACADINSDATTGIVNNPTIGGITCGSTVGVNLCTIETWYDQTGNGFDLATTGITHRTTWLPLGSCTGLTNTGCGHDPGGAIFYFTSGNYTRAQPFSVSVVSNVPSGTTGDQDIMGMRDGAGDILLNNGAFSTPDTFECISKTSGISVTATYGTPHVSQCVFDNATQSKAAIDATITNGTTDTTGSANPVHLLSDYGINTGWVGDFVSAGVASSAFNNTALGSISSNAHTVAGF